MKKRSLIVILSLLIIILAVCISFYFQKVNIKTELAFVIKNPTGKKLDIPPFVFNDYTVSNMNFSFYNWVGDSLCIRPLLNYEKYSYIIGFGSPLKRVYYYPHIQNPNDDCSYLEFTPLTGEYESTYNDTIYFYKIEKGRYRNVCP
jgi:hypothetical protein